MRLLVKKSIPDWHLYITQMETKWTKWYAMTSHVIAYQSTKLLFGTHIFNFIFFFDDFNCVFTQIRCLSRLLPTMFNPSRMFIFQQFTAPRAQQMIIPTMFNPSRIFIFQQFTAPRAQQMIIPTMFNPSRMFIFQ